MHRFARPVCIDPAIEQPGRGRGTRSRRCSRRCDQEADKLGLAYLHILDQGNEPLLADIRARWRQPLILNRPGRAREQIGADVTAGLAELESYGQLILAHPDFVARLQAGAAMNDADRTTCFGGSERGYTDYPPGKGRPCSESVCAARPEGPTSRSGRTPRPPRVIDALQTTETRMAAVRGPRISSAVCGLMCATLAALSWHAIRNGNFPALAVFAAALGVGFLCRYKPCFWKLAVLFFGLLAGGCSFMLFGGLEPNAPGIVATGDWFSLDFLICSLLVASALAAFFAGRSMEAHRARAPRSRAQ